MTGRGVLDRLRNLMGDGASDRRYLLGKGGLDLSARVLGVILVLGWSIMLTRIMGPTDYGRYVYVMSAVYFSSLVGGLGMPVATSYYIQRYIRARGWRMVGYLWTAFAITVLGPGLTTLGVWLAVHLYGGTMFDGFTLFGVLIFGIGTAAVSLLTCANRALEESTFSAYCEQVWQKIASFIFIGGVFLAGASLSPELALAASTFGAWLAALPLLRVVWRKAMAGRSRATFRQVTRLLPLWVRRSMIMMITPLYFIVLSETDVLMLGAITTPAMVAIYHVARRVAMLMRFVQIAVVGVGMHRFAAAHMDRDVTRLQELLDSMTLIAFVPALIGWLSFLVVGPFLLGLFGADMKAGYIALMLLATASVYDISMGPATELLMMTGQEKSVGLINVGAGVLNIVANLLLIPSLQLEGAAIATLLCVLLWKASLAWVAWRRLGVVTPILLRLPILLPQWLAVRR
ncbi:polysaccharide biosynthesis C-terminal domain-containing protein [Rhodospirillum sp. A1_3_36]|uniref:oligosaccharide flippase family protein n=1 Tax=Rhodospirillum sp. A1_3_36 TaxID=3391666 RepID=UPI0039A47BC5